MIHLQKGVRNVKIDANHIFIDLIVSIPASTGIPWDTIKLGAVEIIEIVRITVDLYRIAQPLGNR